jgi:hypothetical protein
LADFFAATRPGSREQPKKSKARDQVLALRKRNYSVYDISRDLKERGISLSATGVREILVEEGFAPLPRRLDEERPVSAGPTTEAVADVRSFELLPCEFKFWTRQLGSKPQHLVFDSQLTAYEQLDRLDQNGIIFITLRRRSAKLIAEIDSLPPSAWRAVNLDVPNRKYRTPKVYEQKVCLRKFTYRQIYIKDLSHDLPTILISNDKKSTMPQLSPWKSRLAR